MKNIEFQNIELTRKRFGSHNPRLEKISSAFKATPNFRDDAISLAGQDKNLAVGKKSGRIEAKTRIAHTKGIDFVTFTKADVVKYLLVYNSIDAYEKNKN
jgi:hypothetical protein